MSPDVSLYECCDYIKTPPALTDEAPAAEDAPGPAADGSTRQAPRGPERPFRGGHLSRRRRHVGGRPLQGELLRHAEPQPQLSARQEVKTGSLTAVLKPLSSFQTISQQASRPLSPIPKPALTKSLPPTPSHMFCLSVPTHPSAPSASVAAEPPLDFSTPAQFTACLDTSAARHRMSIKPRNQRASTKKKVAVVSVHVCTKAQGFWVIMMLKYEKRSRT